MKYCSSLLLISSLLICSPSFAGFTQQIQVCLAVTNGGVGSPLQASFVSSDVFDRQVSTGPVRSRMQTCVMKTYGYGPKNIRLKVEAAPETLRDTSFFTDSSCASYMHKKKSGLAQSNYIATKESQEIWKFHLTQIASRDGYRFSYLLSCEHTSH